MTFFGPLPRNVVALDRNIYDLEAVQDGDTAGGDLAGSYPAPSVSAWRGRPVGLGVPDVGDAYVWDGAAWTPTHVPLEALENGDAAGGDLGGTYPDPSVAAIRGDPVSADRPHNHQVLMWDGARWAPADVVRHVPLWLTRLAVRDGAAHVDDDEFRGTVLEYAQDWTTTNPSGETAVHVANDVLSVLFKNEAEEDLSAASKQISDPSAPKTVEVAYRMAADDRYCLFGLHFSNGTDDGSDLVGFGPNPSVGRVEYRTGSFDDATFDVHTPDSSWVGGNGLGYLRLTWRANNSWAGSWSADGVSWTDAGKSHFAHSLTPTRFGMHWSRWGDGAEPMNVAVEYFRVYDEDLSV